MSSNRAVLDKSKVEKASSKHKKLKAPKTDKGIATKSKNEPTVARQIPDKLAKTRYVPIEQKVTVTAYEIELMKKAELEMLQRIRDMKKRLRHFEKRFDEAVKPDVGQWITRKSNKTCEAIPFYDTAAQTCETNTKENSEKIDELKDMIEQLNSKLLELTEISKCNQLMNAPPHPNNFNEMELTRSIDHLERRIDRLIDFLELRDKKATHLSLSNFAFGELGNGDQPENKIHSVDQLLQSTERLAQNTSRSRKFQSVVIVNEPIYSQV